MQLCLASSSRAANSHQHNQTQEQSSGTSNMRGGGTIPYSFLEWPTVVNSNHGGEYNGRYDGSGEQHPRPFAKSLKECAEARPYKPNEKKLDSRTVSCYFVGYSERSRGFKFYDPIVRTFFETRNARFLEEVKFMG
ncbi:hypothetical protein Q3G72_025860 [Acer saccharum]|nr:hypothetical protein Q3G72_025860 [Acer saccharum]